MVKKPNWKNDTDYNYTKRLDGPGWAWEFLRRNPDYRNDYDDLIAGQIVGPFYEPPKENGRN